MTGEAARVQALYILSNIEHWRHPEAGQVRASLKVISTLRLSDTMHLTQIHPASS